MSILNRAAKGLYFQCIGVTLALTLASGCALNPLSQGQQERAFEDKNSQSSSYMVQETLPKALVTAFAQAVDLMGRDETEAAKALFQKLHDEYPAYSGSAVNLGILWQRSDRDKARDYLQEALKRQPSNYFALNHLGVLARENNEFKQAANYYLEATKLNDAYAPAWYNLGVINEVYLGQALAAIEAYQTYQSLQNEPDSKLDKRIKRLRKRLESQ